jgi:hypothetical protein
VECDIWNGVAIKSRSIRLGYFSSGSLRIYVNGAGDFSPPPELVVLAFFGRSVSYEQSSIRVEGLPEQLSCLAEVVPCGLWANLQFLHDRLEVDLQPGAITEYLERIVGSDFEDAPYESIDTSDVGLGFKSIDLFEYLFGLDLSFECRFL